MSTSTKITSKWLDVKGPDGEFKIYVGIPETDRSPALIIHQEIFGVNSHIRSVVDRYAKEGFLTVAPEMFWRLERNFEVGYEGKDFERALAYYPQFDEDAGLKDLKTVIDYVRAMPECSGKVGILGFCLGGKMAWRAAAEGMVDAAVSYYGGGIQDRTAEAEKINCPLLMHLGEHDDLIPPDETKKIEGAVKAKSNIEFNIYAGASHGFNCDARASYHKPSADLATERSLEMLRKSLL